MLLPEISDAALAYGPWSASKAKLALNCSRGFNLQYIKREKGTPPPARSRRKVGLAAHEVLEMLFKRPGGNIQTYLDLCAEKQGLTSVEIEELTLYKGMIEKFLTRVEHFEKKKMSQGVRTLAETRMAITAEFKPCAFFDNKNGFFRGVLDLGLPTSSGTLVVIDHKARAKGRIEWYADQMKGYRVLGLYGLNIPGYEIRGVQPAVHYILDGSIDWLPMMTTEQISKRMRTWLIEFINHAASNVESGEPTSGKHCDWCSYTKGCPEFQKAEQRVGSKGGTKEERVNF